MVFRLSILFVLILFACSEQTNREKISPQKWENITKKKPSEPFLTVQIFARQFTWSARYPGEDQIAGRINYQLRNNDNLEGLDSTDLALKDDFIATEIHLPVNQNIQLEFESMDVIHCAYLPHFRIVQNVIPGTRSKTNFTAKITTTEMRKNTNDPNFDYFLMCNKICGKGHYNMKIKMVVESLEDFEKWQKWMLEQKYKSDSTILASN